MCCKTKTLTYVGGSKGGTGKSLVTMALIDYLQTRSPDKTLLLFETDSTNPDVGRLFNKTQGITVENLALNESEKNWTNMASLIEQTAASHVIINSMAGANIGIEAQGEYLNGVVENDFVNDFKCLWVMNKDRDSVDLLQQYMERVRYASVYPVKNLYFGREDDFSYYRDSPEGRNIQEMVLKRGGEDFYFPVMNEDLTHMLYTQQLNFEKIKKDLPGGLRISLSRWRSRVKAIFDVVYPYSTEPQNGHSE